MTERFRSRLEQGPILLGSALGTRLLEYGLDLSRDDASDWNLTRPDVILALHAADVAAGADAIVTNTFLAAQGTPARAEARIRGGVELARRVAGPERLVLGSVGPVDAATARFAAGILAAAGVDAILLETQSLATALAAMEAIRGPITLPRIASLHVWPEPVAEALEALLTAGADVVGGNCVTGMAAGVGLAERLAAASAGPFLIAPAAGLPGAELDSPEVFAAAVPRLLALGTRLFGGCCGTTEAHVAALRLALDESRPTSSRRDGA